MRTRSLALLMAFAAAHPAVAQTPPESGQALTVHPEARSAIDLLKSPYCPGQMLAVCPSPGGAMLRDSIQAMALRGMGADSIVERVLAEYGEEWRAQPLRSGAGLWAWILPPAFLVLGLAAVLLVLERRRRTSGEPAPTVEADAEQEARLREAIRELEAEEEPVF